MKFGRVAGLFAVGAVLVVALVVVAAAAPLLTPYDPAAIVVARYEGPTPPAPGHPLGTDTLGRDVWARLAYGARTSLFVGSLAMGARTGGVGLGLAIAQRIARALGQVSKYGNPKQHRWKTLDQEQPLPAGKLPDTTQAQKSAAERPTQHLR